MRANATASTPSTSRRGPSSSWHSTRTASRGRFPLPTREREGAAKRRKGEGVTGYTGQTLAKAQRLRSGMTDAERELWSALRTRRFGGAKFRRQQPIGPYIADFLCQERRLIVEADGGQHAES